MRATLLVAALALATPLAAQDRVPDFMPQPEDAGGALKAYTERPYTPVRMGEVRAAAFLTEDMVRSWGRALGPTTPQQVRSAGSPAIAEVGSNFAVAPPVGGNYPVGDTLLVAMTLPGPQGWGASVVPTGLLEVTARNARQTLTRIVKIYGPIRPGQVVQPIEAVTNPGEVTPVPTPDGPSGTVIGPPTPRELMMPGGQLFIALGRGDGMALGDFVQVRRRPGPRVNAADSIDELMATGQVIHVNGQSSTIRLINILAPDIAPGTPVVRVATLP